MQPGRPRAVEAEPSHQDDARDRVIRMAQAGPGEVVVNEPLSGESAKQTPDNAVLQSGGGRRPGPWSRCRGRRPAGSASPGAIPTASGRDCGAPGACPSCRPRSGRLPGVDRGRETRNGRSACPSHLLAPVASRGRRASFAGRSEMAERKWSSRSASQSCEASSRFWSR